LKRVSTAKGPSRPPPNFS